MNMEKNNYKDLTREEFIKELSKYYSEKLKKEITVNYDVNIIWNDNLSLSVYFEKYRYNNIDRIDLNDEDIRICFESYAKELGLELENFKYIGGIRQVGYFFKENTPHFDGIRLYFKEKTKTLIKK